MNDHGIIDELKDVNNFFYSDVFNESVSPSNDI